MPVCSVHRALVLFPVKLQRSQTAHRYAPPALGPRLALPHAPRAQQELPTQTRAPPASPSASPALQVNTLLSVDKARAPSALPVHGATKLAHSLLLSASHAPPGRTILYQVLLV